ncbi:amidohydrolase family protein, partial [Aduncisulcus paluster]
NLSRGLVAGEGSDAKLEEAIQLRKDWHGKCGGRVTVDLAPHAPYSCDESFMKKVLEASEVHDTRIHIHLSESLKEVEDSYKAHNKSPIQNVFDQGVFKRPTFAAHCVHLSDEDIYLLRDNKVSVVNNPGSNLKLGNGFA